MRYALVLITDGRAGMLDRTLAAFDRYVRPRPSFTLIFDDSGDQRYRGYLTTLMRDRGDPNHSIRSFMRRQGFCRNVAAAWEFLASGRSDEAELPDWVYWLEDDFAHLRAVDLEDLATVMSHEPQVAQMALYRNPVNAEELAAGGYIALRPDTYEQRGLGSAMAWLEHRNFWTTNPSLFRRSLCARVPWTASERCEGKFAFELARHPSPNGQKWSFGIWGTGEPWVEHLGVRAGTGY